MNGYILTFPYKEKTSIAEWNVNEVNLDLGQVLVTANK